MPFDPTVTYLTNYVQNNAASNISELEDLNGFAVSDPPAQAEVQTVVDKLNELIAALKAT
jgi:hypothetical protein